MSSEKNRSVNPANSSTTPSRVVVCLGRSCSKYNSQKVFDNFKQRLPSGVELISVRCLGQCGSGPMVVVEPDQIWYDRVHPDEVDVAIEQHIVGKSPVKKMLYSKFHK